MRLFDDHIGQLVCRYIIPEWVKPNHLSVGRLMFAIPIIIYRDVPWVGTVLAIIAYLSDGLDGMVARIRHQTSEEGALLDADMDKLFLFLCLWVGCTNRVILWVKVVVTVFDATSFVVHRYKYRHHIDTRANRWGGLKTWAHGFGVSFVFTQSPFFTRFVTPTFVIATLFALASLIFHVRDIFRHRHNA
jgi:phosphatidylglycerophosphate synthase